MEQRKIRTLVNRQRRFFYTGKTQHMAFREMALRRLQISIMAHEDEINRALRLDLGKSASEAYMCETGMVLAEISYMLKHMRQFGKNQTVRTPLAQFASRSFRKPSPYGVTLIMSPWNYPFLLTMEPLVDALAAGNTAIVKPSAYSPFTSEIMEKIISIFLDELVFQLEQRIIWSQHGWLLVEFLQELLRSILLVYYQAEHVLVEPIVGHDEATGKTIVCTPTVLHLPLYRLAIGVEIYSCQRHGMSRTAIESSDAVSLVHWE